MNDLHDELSPLAGWLFKGWSLIVRGFVMGVLAYTGLLLLLRTSGKWTLSKLNVFDLIVAVALGSTLATILMSRQTGLTDGVTGLAVLVSLQYVVAWLSTRWSWFKKFIESKPTLPYFQGQYLKQTMCGQRVLEDEVLMAIRQSGTARLDEVQATVPGTDGSFTVVTSPDRPSAPDSQSSLSSINPERTKQTA